MIRHPFFITGMPRSRTAWLANLFTTDQTLCHHDTPYEEHLTISPRRVGFSGPELVTQFNQIAADHPDAPWVVVLRKCEDAKESFKRVANPFIPADYTLDQFWNVRAHMVAELSKHANVFTVSYACMDEERVAREMWVHLVPGISFDLERWKLLKGLNVQQDLKKAQLLWQLEQSRA